MIPIGSSEITPEHLYHSRRQFLTGVGAMMTSVLLLGGCARPSPEPSPGGTDFCDLAKAGQDTDELGDPLTPCEDVLNYNNYYEFSTSKEGIGRLARDFQTSPWEVAVGGAGQQAQDL